jgi:hypothetical protein
VLVVIEPEFDFLFEKAQKNATDGDVFLVTPRGVEPLIFRMRT